MADVTLDGISKRFGSLAVIEGLDLSVRDGEFVILVGESGCGKSTTLRIVAGLEAATDGAVRIGGRDVTGLAPGRRNCAMVFQSYALYPHMTVAENIGFGMRVRGVAAGARATAVRNAAGTLALGSLLDRYPRALSGGQRQRVAIGRAIVRSPDAFLFDEPLSNLDAKLRIEMRAEIKELHRSLGATMIHVTHDQVEAMTMADRVVVMDKGRIAQAAAPIELYERPSSMFVAGFIGAPGMNFLPVEVGAGGAGKVLRLGTGEVVAAPASWSGLAPGRRLVLGIRPEHATHAPTGVNLTVRLVEPLGSRTLVTGTVGASPLTAKVDPHLPVKPGDALPIAFDMRHAHAFEPGSGLRLQGDHA